MNSTEQKICKLVCQIYKNIYQDTGRNNYKIPINDCLKEVINRRLSLYDAICYYYVYISFKPRGLNDFFPNEKISFNQAMMSRLNQIRAYKIIGKNT